MFMPTVWTPAEKLAELDRKPRISLLLPSPILDELRALSLTLVLLRRKVLFLLFGSVTCWGECKS